MIRQYKPLEPIGRRCRIDDCDETARRGPLCDKHGQRVKKYGDPNAMHLLKKGERPK